MAVWSTGVDSVPVDPAGMSGMSATTKSDLGWLRKVNSQSQQQATEPGHAILLIC